MLQLRAHFEDALKLGKPLVLGEFGKQHYSSMAVRRDFTARIYGEVEAWNAKHGNVAGERACQDAQHVMPPWTTDISVYAEANTRAAAKHTKLPGSGLSMSRETSTCVQDRRFRIVPSSTSRT